MWAALFCSSKPIRPTLRCHRYSWLGLSAGFGAISDWGSGGAATPPIDPAGTTYISTRLFWLRPSSVALETRGRYSPETHNLRFGWPQPRVSEIHRKPKSPGEPTGASSSDVSSWVSAREMGRSSVCPTIVKSNPVAALRVHDSGEILEVKRSPIHALYRCPGQKPGPK